MGMLNIDAFRNSGLKGYVMLQEVGNGQSGAAAELVSTGNGRIGSRLDRWFNTENRQKMSHEVLASLHRTLSAQYSRDIAHQAMAAVFKQAEVEQAESGVFRSNGPAHQRVTAGQIRDVLAQVERLTNPRDNVVKISLGYDSKGVVYRIGNGEAKRMADAGRCEHAIITVAKALFKANRFIASDPALGRDVETVKSSIRKAIANLIETKDRFMKDVDGVHMNGASALAKIVGWMPKSIDNCIADLQDLCDQYDDLPPDPVGKDMAKDCLELWQKAGEKLIDTYAQYEKDGIGLSPYLKEQFKGSLERWIDQRLNPSDGFVEQPFDLKRALDNIRKDMAKYLKGLFAEKDFTPPKNLGKILKRLYSDELNRQPWDPIRKEFSVKVANDRGTSEKECKITSVITPAKHISGGGAKLDYRNVNGVNCHTPSEKKGNHAVNLAQSQLMIKGDDGVEKQIFNGIRHGVHQTKAGAIETVKASFLSRPDLIAKALENPEAPFKLNMTSVSLLTPFLAEGTMTKEQEQAWAEVNGDTIPITVKNSAGEDVEIRIQPNVTNFTLSSNPAKVISSLDHKRSLGLGWGKVDGSNAASYTKFMARVDDFLAENANSQDPEVQKKCKYVSILGSQLRTIWEADSNNDDESYKLEKGGAYKASARIAVMSYLMGDVPCWNCKSGKDRTGMMDVECKYFATLVAQGREIPPPAVDMSKSDKRLFRDLVLKSGNMEMQKYNTGLAGYKALDRADTVRNRLGGWIARAEGASKYAKK